MLLGRSHDLGRGHGRLVLLVEGARRAQGLALAERLGGDAEDLGAALLELEVDERDGDGEPVEDVWRGMGVSSSELEEDDWLKCRLTRKNRSKGGGVVPLSER